MQNGGSEALVKLATPNERRHFAIRENNVAVGQCGREGMDVMDIVVCPWMLGISVHGCLQSYGDVEARHGVEGTSRGFDATKDVVKRLQTPSVGCDPGRFR